MVDLPGYQITERIKIGINTVIYRGVRQQDGQSVFLKILAKEYPTLEELTRLKHEYEITHNLDIPGIVKPLALKKHQNRLALILEDFGGESLQKFIANKKLGLEEFLKIAIQLAATLGSLHKNQIIHKDIKPANIIINPSTREVKITDFSISSRLSRENQTIRNPNLLEGTLAYMSPEQTGRMNRSIDYRTDLYSLGVTFYEILTGKLPHQATDPMELVYCHIAKTPVSPKQLNPEIPQAVSDIVMKLLSKTAEDRYQSGLGLKADLETCLTQLLATGKIDNFILGQQDLSGKLLIPQKLYGREAEVATLVDAFERVSGGTKEMMLVSGYSGIGKSCLVNELHKPILRQRGYFISGKFDQFKRNIPYSSLIQAFQELMRQLLTESEENIAAWNSKLLAAFGPNGQIIIDVIPEVELIVGKQPSVSQLDGSESQNRFNLVFKQFIGVFTQKEHPLVLFLDDLQWADSASLKLIHLLMSDPDSQYLLLIGAYRDNEVGATHPLMLTLEEIENSGAIVNAIALKPLGLDTINQLVADTLSCDQEQSQPLAELLLDKTAGNPFFLTQLLKSLYQENLLAYNPPYLHPSYQGGDKGGQGGSKGGWQWDISLLHRMGITDNVVELMVGKIQKLDDNTQNVLKLAACIGNRFDLDVLTIVNEKSLKATAAELWPALQSGLILTRSDAYKIPLVIDESSLVNCQGQRTNDSGPMTITYKFLHDRVQQAAYALIPQSHKKEVHLKVGQLLLQNTYPEEREEKIFEIVNHLNLGKELITDRSQRDELAQLNLIAGQKAKAATAYELAIRYLTVGLKLLAEDSWTRQYDLTLALYVETVEAEFLNTNFERSETLGEVVLQNATKLLDQVKVYELKIQIYAAQLMMPLAVDTGLQVLEMLGYPVSSNSRDERGLVKLPGMADLEDMPEMTDPYQLAAMRILMNITVPAQNSRPDIFPQVMLTMVNLCIEYGHSKLAAFAYSWYGLLLCGAHGDIDGGYYSGQLALMLLEQFQANSLKAKVLVLFNGHVRYWKDHAREGIAPLLEGVKTGLETGDIEYASYCALHYCVLMFFVGEPLETVEQSSAPYIDILQKYKQEIAIYYNNVWIQLRLNLVGRAADKYRLIGSSFDEEAMLPRFHEAKNGTLLFITYSAKGILLYLFKEYAAAVENASRAAEYKEFGNGTMAGALHNFYYSLALLAHYPNVATNEQQQILRLVAANQEKMQQWAYHAQGNFQHKYDLVEAEKARVLGQIGGAIACYDRAIKGARVQGYIQEEALAYEKAAEFYIALGGEEIAQTYMTKAYYGYVRWGAKAKVKDLETRYPNFTTIPFTNTERLQVTSVTTSTTGGDAGVLDFATVMKASQAIAGEIVLGSLLDKLMRIVIENAGAQTGLLILDKDGKMQIEATGAVDKDEVVVCQSTPIELPKMPMSVINYVKRTKENVVLNDATRERFFDKDPYIIANKPKSVLCTPIINKGKLIGILYFENNLTTGAFTPNRLEIFKILSSQVAISIENALLYTELSKANECLKQAYEQLEEYSRNLEQKVQDRTLELKEKNRRLREQATQLKQALQELQQTQSQLIQTEKMSSLGQMVAGVAHEINNPISFIYGNIIHASKYIEDLLSLLNLYQQEYPNPTPAIQHEIEAIELEFLNEDLPKLLSSMQVGAERIRQIVLSLRNFSRLDEAEMKPVDIHEGIDSTLLILQNRLKANAGNPGIQVIKEYGNLPPVECFAGQLNQVFMNLIANAIDVLEECNLARSHLPTIRIRTQVLDGERVAISIADNGPGMTEEVRDRIFDPFFTTKPVGKGTGLGLSISYQIVVEKHGGQLKCNSTPGQGAEFIIEIPIRQ